MGAIDYPFGTYPRAIIRSELTSHAKALYVTLADYTTVSRLQCFPSKTRLCSQLKWSDHTLEKYTRELIATGWIARESRRDEGGRFRGWLYTINTSPNPDSDQAGGSAKPIAGAASSATRQTLRVEEKQEFLKEETQGEEQHTVPKSTIPGIDTCVCDPLSAQKNQDETSVESLTRTVTVPRSLLPGTEGGRVFNSQEIETIELTIERYRAQGTLKNLPGLIRYFSVHGVDTTSLSGLRQWKAEQGNKAQTEDGTRELDSLRIFEKHILSCKRCKPGELCEEGEGLRPRGPEQLGCWGCGHFERYEGLAELNMGRCRFQDASVRHPMTHQCAVNRIPPREGQGE